MTKRGRGAQGACLNRAKHGRSLRESITANRRSVASRLLAAELLLAPPLRCSCQGHRTLTHGKVRRIIPIREKIPYVGRRSLGPKKVQLHVAARLSHREAVNVFSGTNRANVGRRTYA